VQIPAFSFLPKNFPLTLRSKIKSVSKNFAVPGVKRQRNYYEKFKVKKERSFGRNRNGDGSLVF
jgi:hypothetical protein